MKKKSNTEEKVLATLKKVSNVLEFKTSNESFDKALEDAKSKLPNDLNEINLEYEILSEKEFQKLKNTTI